MLPRKYTSYYAQSKAIGINERVKMYCSQKKVEFVDVWKIFIGKWKYFRKDGIHLSEIGHRKLEEILSRECARLMNSDQKNTGPSPDDMPSSQVQETLEKRNLKETPENSNLDNSFEGFNSGN